MAADSSLPCEYEPIDGSWVRRTSWQSSMLQSLGAWLDFGQDALQESVSPSFYILHIGHRGETHDIQYNDTYTRAVVGDYGPLLDLAISHGDDAATLRLYTTASLIESRSTDEDSPICHYVACCSRIVRGFVNTVRSGPGHVGDIPLWLEWATSSCPGEAFVVAESQHIDVVVDRMLEARPDITLDRRLSLRHERSGWTYLLPAPSGPLVRLVAVIPDQSSYVAGQPMSGDITHAARRRVIASDWTCVPMPRDICRGGQHCREISFCLSTVQVPKTLVPARRAMNCQMDLPMRGQLKKIRRGLKAGRQVAIICR